jgi:hypothetical protein
VADTEARLEEGRSGSVKQFNKNETRRRALLSGAFLLLI